MREADLKLKEVKCNFLKKHIQYLGHIVLGKGITRMPEKLACIKEMPPPKTPKEVKQFLGLIGYYQKFVPRLSDLARPLNALTRKDVPFEWTPICQESFELLKTSLMTEPILTYPDPNLPYVLFTDASKYPWACVLMQEKTHQIEEKEVKILHPITYMSGLFRGSQMNWACLTKEAYAIYMSIKKLAYYLEDADIPLRSDHLPLKKFLAKNTLNSKVNNWAIEISPFCITFEFGYYTFDTLPAMEVSNIEAAQHNSSDNEKDFDENLIKLLLTDKIMSELQEQYTFCSNILAQIEKGNIKEGQTYKVQNKLLKRYVTNGDKTYETIILPRALTAQILKMAHGDLGHNGTHRTCMLLKRLYY